MAQVSLSQFSPSFNSSSNISNNSSYRSISSGGGELGACSADSSPVHPSKSPDIAALEKLSESIESLLSIADLDCSDAEIVVQDRAVPVHRCILAARSPFFREKLFPSTRTESQAASAKLRYELKDWLTEGNVGYEAFRILLAYLYSGKVKAPPTEVCICMDGTCVHDACRPAVDFAVELMYAAHIFQIPELVSLSQRRLLNFVERAQVEDVIPILIAANVCETGNDQLLTRCIHRVGRSDLDNVALEKELPQEAVKRVKEFRSSLGVATFPSSSQQKNIQRIQRALDSDDVELVKLLLHEGEGKIILDDAYALHYAAAYCDPKITSELLELGCADVNLKNTRGYTVLHIAAMRREPATIVALLTKGAHPSELTFDERTALQISRRLTRAIDYCRTTDEGKESPKDRLCIEILERAESRNPLRAEVPLSLAFAGEDMRTKLLDLENRVALAKILFPTEAKLAMEIAHVDATSEFTVDLNETPTAVMTKKFIARMKALSRTVELGKHFFPRCSAVLNKIMDDDLPEITLEEQRVKRKRYDELKTVVSEAFSKDKADIEKSGMSSSSSSSSVRDGLRHKNNKYR